MEDNNYSYDSDENIDDDDSACIFDEENIRITNIQGVLYVMKMGNDISLNHEANMLSRLNHPNIIKFYGMYGKGNQKHLLLEYMYSDLSKYINNMGKLQPLSIKNYMWQLLRGIQYCHSQGIIHRDIKPANLLIDTQGHIKLADFGNAVIYQGPNFDMPISVGTSGYTPPDVLLGNSRYAGDIDMWGLGCVLGEMLIGQPLLDVSGCESQYEEMAKIFDLIGVPNQNNSLYFQQFPSYAQYMSMYLQYPRPVSDSLALILQLDDASRNFLIKFLQYSPSYRISINDALNDPYFNDFPYKY
ncbi:Protein kinase [Orpheovirus IHUMI-LCC2]|uniref:Protein kinase n=1 Tax=Orpheovirus IHUMI-LCC2 TaxID=2023057 RepID=A0A2I2L4T9_9VIRU|nr:Protein kinase [Orpheovirus IHUMI-LCC2]SNW62520.1 Protein kinase [Orpheovirus IHUMI-LCC2]